MGPDLSRFGNELPDLGELLPEEVKYLRRVCRLLHEIGLPARGGVVYHDPDFEPFDPDELGLDPEQDGEYY